MSKSEVTFALYTLIHSITIVALNKCSLYDNAINLHGLHVSNLHKSYYYHYYYYYYYYYYILIKHVTVTTLLLYTYKDDLDNILTL